MLILITKSSLYNFKFNFNLILNNHTNPHHILSLDLKFNALILFNTTTLLFGYLEKFNYQLNSFFIGNVVSNFL